MLISVLLKNYGQFFKKNYQLGYKTIKRNRMQKTMFFFDELITSIKKLKALINNKNNEKKTSDFTELKVEYLFQFYRH